jgi:oxaloacetate decarboxylase alpha subunit
MSAIKLIDVSMRDGNQSLWGAVGVRTRTIERALPAMGRVGYRAIEIASSTMIATAVRYHSEDPWARLDAARRAAPDATFSFLTTGKRFITFSRTPANLQQLSFDLLRKHGVTRMLVIDPMYDMDSVKETARMVKQAGFDEVICGICYTRSPVHTDDFFADRVSQVDDCPDIDGVYLKDPAGLLTPECLTPLVQRMRSRLSRLKLAELHTHCNTGNAPRTLLAGADLGMTTLHCALPPLTEGPSHTSGLQLTQNLRARGHTVDVDLDAMQQASDILRREAVLRHLPQGQPWVYDEAYYRHTLPGGVLSTTRRQLAEIGRVQLMPAVIEEAVHVRSDLGWPIIMTPFAQYIVTQAALNVMAGERYRQISDEVIDMLMGDWGPMPGQVNSELLDRAMSSVRARKRSTSTSAEPPSLAALRQRFGAGISDEDLLLRAVMPTEQVDAMVNQRGQRGDLALRELAQKLSDPQRPLTLQVQFGDARLTLKGGRTNPASKI